MKFKVIDESAAAVLAYTHGYKIKRSYIVQIVWGYDDWNFIRTTLKRQELLTLFKQYTKKAKYWRIEGAEKFVKFVNKKIPESSAEIKQDYSIGESDLRNDCYYVVKEDCWKYRRRQR